MDSEVKARERSIYRVTLAGSLINVALLIFKFAAGILGHSAAMIADAVHSLSDFLTDIVVLVFVHISGKPQDAGHDYGHGKYETLATAIIGVALLVVGLMIFVNGATKVWAVVNGAVLPAPGWIALVAALLSLVLKEWAYRFTARVGRRVDSEALVANAWHHRSDALSSVGTALGIGGALLLGHGWTVLDPLAALVVSVMIVAAAVKLLRPAIGDLLDQSLPASVEQEIVKIVLQEPCVTDVHNLRTRRIGSAISIEMHLRMPGSMSLYETHQHATSVEHRLRAHFGEHTYINLHIEPVKVNGKYKAPE